jgi:hypothetical protein
MPIRLDKENQAFLDDVNRGSAQVIYENGDPLYLPETVDALARLLPKNTTLTQLVFVGTYISEAGVIALAQGLRLNTRLTTLSLANNHINDTGAKALAKALGDLTPALKTQNKLLQDKKILQQNERAFQNNAIRLQENKKILERHKDSYTSDDFKQIIQAKEREIAINTSKLSTNTRALKENAQALEENQTELSLQTNNSLTVLDLRHNKITDEGASALFKALETNTSIIIDLSDNLISMDMLVSLKETYHERVICEVTEAPAIKELPVEHRQSAIEEQASPIPPTINLQGWGALIDWATQAIYPYIPDVFGQSSSSPEAKNSSATKRPSVPSYEEIDSPTTKTQDISTSKFSPPSAKK